MKNIARTVDAWYRKTLSMFNDGIVPFTEGRFAAAADRPAFAARIYYEIDQLARLMSVHGITPDRSIEIGCGYGRMTPWISRFSERHIATEPDDAARNRAIMLYPGIEFIDADATDLPFRSNRFDFALSWTVLQHVDDVGAAAAELDRVVRRGGHAVLTEKTTGEETAVVHPRSVSEYRDLMPNFRLVSSPRRKTEPERENTCHVMLFEKVRS